MMLERQPNTTKAQTAGSKTNQPVGLIDLYPTLIELCSLSQNERLDGVSFAPLLRDPSAKSNAAPAASISARASIYRISRP